MEPLENVLARLDPRVEESLTRKAMMDMGLQLIAEASHHLPAAATV